MRVPRAGQRQIGHVGVEVAVAPGTVVLGVGHVDLARASTPGVPDVEEQPLARLITSTGPSALGAGAASRTAGPVLEDRLGELGRVRDPLSRILDVLAYAHREALPRGQRPLRGQQIGSKAKDLPSKARLPRYSLLYFLTGPKRYTGLIRRGPGHPCGNPVRQVVGRPVPVRTSPPTPAARCRTSRTRAGAEVPAASHPGEGRHPPSVAVAPACRGRRA